MAPGQRGREFSVKMPLSQPGGGGTPDDGSVTNVKVAAAAAIAASKLALTLGNNVLTGDVTLTTANTFYDGPSVSLVAGTWFIIASVIVTIPGATGFITGRLWDGATVYKESEEHAVAGANKELVTVAVVVLGSTTTVKISVTSTDTTGGTGRIRATAPQNGTTNKASSLEAIRIA